MALWQNGQKTAENYLSAINKILPERVKEPKDLHRIIKGKKKYLPIDLENFLNFLEEQYYITELNGYHFSLWRKHCQENRQLKRLTKRRTTRCL